MFRPEEPRCGGLWGARSGEVRRQATEIPQIGIRLGAARSPKALRVRATLYACDPEALVSVPKRPFVPIWNGRDRQSLGQCPPLRLHRYRTPEAGYAPTADTSVPSCLQ